MEKLAAVLAQKQPAFQYITLSAAVSDAIHKMRCQNMDYLVVLDENQQFAGIVSEHEIMGHAMLYEKPLQQVRVKDIMNNSMPHAEMSDTVESCMKLMQQHHLRFIPVFEDFTFIGVISSDDIMREAISRRENIFDA